MKWLNIIIFGVLFDCICKAIWNRWLWAIPAICARTIVAVGLGWGNCYPFNAFVYYTVVNGFYQWPLQSPISSIQILQPAQSTSNPFPYERWNDYKAWVCLYFARAHNNIDSNKTITSSKALCEFLLIPTISQSLIVLFIKRFIITGYGIHINKSIVIVIVWWRTIECALLNE